VQKLKLLALVPTQYRVTAIFLLCVALFSYGWVKGANSVHGNAILGDMPVGISYIKYETEFFIGYNVEETVEINTLFVS